MLLLIEDDEDQARRVVREVRRMATVVRTVTDALRARRPRAVLMDSSFWSPAASGALREALGAPIVLLSDSIDEPAAERILATGAIDGYVDRVDPRQMRAVISAVLVRRRRGAAEAGRSLSSFLLGAASGRLH